MATDTPPRRPLGPRAIVAIVAAVSLTLAVAYYGFLRVDYAVLYSGLKPAEASAIVEELAAKGVQHQVGDGGTTISVPAGDVDTVKVALAGSELPMKGAVGFELFNKSDMGLTDFAQKINYQRALQGELGRTIMMMEGVETARIHLAIPERSLFRGNQATPKAAVEVIARPGQPLSQDRVSGIQQLVAAAVPDLPVAAVVVLDGNGKVLSTATSAQGVQTPEAEERTAAQNYYSARAKAAIIARLPGLDLAVRTLALDRQDTAESSATRNFGLRVLVVTAAQLNPEDEKIARDAAATAVALDEAGGDSIAFEVGPTSVQSNVPAALPVTADDTVNAIAQPSATDTVSSAYGWEWLVVAIAALAAAALILLRKRQPALAPDQRDALVDRLRTYLSEPERSDAA